MSEQPVRFTGAIRFAPRGLANVPDDRWNDVTLGEILSSLLYAQAYESTLQLRPRASGVVSHRIQWVDSGVQLVNADITSLYDELHAEFERLDAPATS